MTYDERSGRGDSALGPAGDQPPADNIAPGKPRLRRGDFLKLALGAKKTQEILKRSDAAARKKAARAGATSHNPGAGYVPPDQRGNLKQVATLSVEDVRRLRAAHRRMQRLARASDDEKLGTVLMLQPEIEAVLRQAQGEGHHG